VRRRLAIVLALLLGAVYATPADQPATPQGAPGPLPAPPPAVPPAAPKPEKSVFTVKYVSDGTVYLDAGKNAGLEVGMVLHLVHSDGAVGTTDAVRFQGVEPIADVRIFSVADSSSAAEIIKSTEDLATGDIAYLDVQSVHAREDRINAEESEKYPVVVTFSYGDPLDEEIRATKVTAKTRPPENLIRGRLGLDLGYLSEQGGASSRQIGLLIDADSNRIGGTHWDFRGYWRGDFNTQNSGNIGGVSPQTLSNLLNRTYHLGLFYENPDSIVTIGVGRLYVPYATSLSTVDGGYFGERIRPSTTVGVFGGSTPDPTSWSYAPNQHIAGTFLNYTHGDFDHVRFNDTFGLAMTSIGLHAGREFIFAENTISIGRTVSFYNSLQADKARTVTSTISYKTGLTQSFSSIRFQPIHLLTFDLNHNYLRNLPSFDPVLISTGLVDQYLFQGLSGGVQVQLPYRVTVSTDVGRSKNVADKGPSWNQMYGLTFGEIRKTGLQLDLRYTKFNSTFGSGQYEYVSVSRTIADRFHIQLQGGTQRLNSTFSANSNSTFITSIVDWSLGPRYFFEGLYSWNRGSTMNYQQTNFTFGYRFGGAFRK